MSEVNKEIDLIELYQRILIFVYKYFLTFAVFALIGLLSGSAYYYKKSSLITTDFLVESTEISKELVYSMTEKIQFLIDTEDFESLKSRFSLEEDVLSQIDEIEIDTTGSIFRISMVSQSESSVPLFTNALIQHYNTNEYIQNTYLQKQKKTKALLHQIDQEIQKIELFQEQFLKGQTGGAVTINQMDGSHSEKLRLFKMKQDCEDILQETTILNLINKDSNILKQKVSLVKTLAFSVLLSLVISLLYFFIRFSIALKNEH